MNDDTLTEVTPVSHIALDTSHLTTWEDHIQAFLDQQIEKEHIQWSQADIILSVYQKFGGEKSVVKFASELRLPRSTVEHYIRTAIAYPPPKRLQEVNFSIHTEASYVDQFDGKQQSFDGEKRFNLVEEAADNRITVAEMKKKVKREKIIEDSGDVKVACYLCGQTHGEVKEYLVLSKSDNTTRRTADNFDLHEGCWLVIKSLIENERQNRQL